MVASSLRPSIEGKETPMYRYVRPQCISTILADNINKVDDQDAFPRVLSKRSPH